MPRKGPAPRRPLVADPVYNSPLVTSVHQRPLSAGRPGDPRHPHADPNEEE